MSEYKSPGIYVKELPLSSPTLVEVKTAVPAFVGYTETAKDIKNDDLRLKPTKITSMRAYERYFGGPQKTFPNEDGKRFSVDVLKAKDGNITNVHVYEPDLVYTLYYAMKMFFANGGRDCYIVSVSGYNMTSPEILLDDIGNNYGLMDGLNTLKGIGDVTLLVIPEAVNLDETCYRKMVHAMLNQCNDLQDRFAVMDIYDGNKKLNTSKLSSNRTKFGNTYLKFGAAYYPFLKTSIHYQIDENSVYVTMLDRTKSVRQLKPSAESIRLKSLKYNDNSVYNAVIKALKKYYIVLPPSSTVVGIYAATDASKGVWKAPANVRLNDVIKPVINIDNALQSNLNADAVSGKSINAIRAFSWKDTLIWGARTLAGNDNEWRYVPIRRLCINIEETIKKSTHWTVFEENNTATWEKVENMIKTYLTSKWQQGALVGETSEQAFFVRCGLGSTMNASDLTQGRLNIELGIAVLRPAEFIVLKISHYLPSS